MQIDHPDLLLKACEAGDDFTFAIDGKTVTIENQFIVCATEIDVHQRTAVAAGVVEPALRGPLVVR